MLNMTRIAVDQQSPSTTLVRLEIDLGQSLLTPSAYWQISQAPKEHQLRLLQPVLQTLADSVKIETAGRRLALQLERWHLAANSLEAIKNPLTPQMATLTYRINLGTSQDLVVTLSDSLEVPWPTLLRVDSPARSLPISRLLTASQRTSNPINLASDNTEYGWSEQLGDMALDTLPALTWIAVGFQHIVPRGLDHILFILGLFFMAAGTRPLLWQVTGFTIAHSVTLAMASYGLIQIPAAIVEPLIAASIIYIAVDNLYARSVGRIRFIMVCVFGLLHGLGFASVLNDLQLPEADFMKALLAFNIGVETGQLAILAAAFAVVGWCRRREWYITAIAQPATLAIAGVGLYWLLHRTVI
ncbi:MAG: HupE/UreJ family protein [Pseudomonadales bacterium]